MTGAAATIPTLETERLVLRAPVYADFEPYAEINMSDRASYMGGPMSRRAAWQMFCTETAPWWIQGFGYWTCALKEAGDVVGFTGFNRLPVYEETEFGWQVRAGFEGRGLAFEATAAALAYARAELNFPSLVSYIDPENVRSQALARRLGAVQDDTAPVPEDETPEECLVFRHWPTGSA
ncbi:MAG: GNAT family N-acetyltransferase [Pseudomonadota bacterium]